MNHIEKNGTENKFFFQKGMMIISMLKFSFALFCIKTISFQDGTHVTEPCTSNPDTCTDSNANCNGTVCDCISGFAWNGSLCGNIYIFFVFSF